MGEEKPLRVKNTNRVSFCFSETYMGKTKGLGHLWVVIRNGRTPFWGNIPFGFRKTPVRSSNNYEVVMFCLDYGIRWVRCSKIPFSLLQRKREKKTKLIISY